MALKSNTKRSWNDHIFGIYKRLSYDSNTSNYLLVQKFTFSCLINVGSLCQVKCFWSYCSNILSHCGGVQGLCICVRTHLYYSCYWGIPVIIQSQCEDPPHFGKKSSYLKLLLSSEGAGLGTRYCWVSSKLM